MTCLKELICLTTRLLPLICPLTPYSQCLTMSPFLILLHIIRLLGHYNVFLGLFCFAITCHADNNSLIQHIFWNFFLLFFQYIIELFLLQPCAEQTLISLFSLFSPFLLHFILPFIYSLEPKKKIIFYFLFLKKIIIIRCFRITTIRSFQTTIFNCFQFVFTCFL